MRKFRSIFFSILCTALLLCIHLGYAGTDQCPYGYCTEQVTKSMQELERLAKSGDVTAQYQFGWLLFENAKNPVRNGVKSQQVLDSEYWIKKAAESGLDKAQYLLGELYGSTIFRDEEKAFFWHKQAAEQGYAKACYAVGHAYFAGIGVTQEKAEGLKWMTQAAELGDYFAQRRLALKYEERELKDDKKAAYWLLKLAERGDKSGAYEIASRYESGLGVEQNDFEALRWYRKASELHHAIADDRIGVFYENGRGGVKQDYSEAIKWYKKSGARGFGLPYYRIGLLYEEGRGVRKNYAEAADWYIKSIKIGDSCGDEDKASHLARLYEEGLGVAKDAEKAKKLRQHAEQKKSAYKKCSEVY
jgi:uncharacterized protein